MRGTLVSSQIIWLEKRVEELARELAEEIEARIEAQKLGMQAMDEAVALRKQIEEMKK